MAKWQVVPGETPNEWKIIEHPGQYWFGTKGRAFKPTGDGYDLFTITGVRVSGIQVNPETGHVTFGVEGYLKAGDDRKVVGLEISPDTKEVSH